MPDPQKTIHALLLSLLSEYGSRISIDGSSRLLASDLNIATSIAEATANVRTPYGPTITIAARGGNNTPSESDVSAIPGGNASVREVDKLPMDHYTHALFALNSEDPKFVLQGLKHTLYALQPKGIAIVISVKQETGKKDEEGGQVTVGLEEKIKYQSRGKAEGLGDVLEFAGFERGKIRRVDRRVEVEGEGVEAEVVLAMKWDQLTA